MFLERAADAPSVVAVMVPMVPEGLFATWGAQRVGTAVPLNPFLELASLVAVRVSLGWGDEKTQALRVTPIQVRGGQ